MFRFAPIQRTILTFTVISLTFCFAFSPNLVKAEPADDEYTLGLTLYGQMRWDLARDTFQNYLKTYPNHNQRPLAKLYLSQSLINLKDYKQARVILREFLKEHPKNKNLPQAMYRVAECSYFLDDYKSAINEFEVFVSSYPEDQLVEWALPYLADAQLRTGKPEQAQKQFEQSLKKFPKGRFKVDSQFGLARSLELQAKLRLALEQYAKLTADEQNARLDEALFNSGMIHFQLREYNEAADTFLRLADRDPQAKLTPLARLNAGYAYYSLSDWEAAKEQFGIAELNTEYRDTAKLWIALCEKGAGDYEEAAQALETLLRRKPSEELLPKVKFQLAHCKFQLQDYEAALPLYLEYQSTWPKQEFSAESYLGAVECYLLTNQLGKGWELSNQEPPAELNKREKLQLTLLQAKLLGNPNSNTDPLPTDLGDKTKRLERAGRLLEKEIVSQPETLNSLMQQYRYQGARIAEQLGNHRAVVTLLEPLTFNRADDVSLEIPAAWLLLANSQYELGQYEDSLKSLDELEKAGVSSSIATQATIVKINALVKLKRTSDAIALLPQLEQANLDPNSMAEALYQLAETSYAAQEWGSAQKLYGQLINLNPGPDWVSKALSGLGWSLFEDEQFAKASETFDELLEKFPQDQQGAVDAGYMKAMALLRDGKNTAAAEAFVANAEKFASEESAETGNAINHVAYRSAREAARIYREENEIKKSDQAYEVAYQELKKQPAPRNQDLDKLLDEWALLHFEAEQFEQADRIFELIVTETPNSDRADDATLSLAESEFIDGKLPEARTRLEKLLESGKPDNYVRNRSLYQLIMIAASQNDFDSVKKFAEKYLKSASPQNTDVAERGEVQLQLAQLYLDEDKNDLAKVQLTDLHKRLDALDKNLLPPWSIRVSLLRGELARREKRYQDLAEILEKVKADDPESTEREQLEVIVGRSMIAQAKFPEAEKRFREVLDRAAGVKTLAAAQSQFYLAEVALIKKDYPTAIREYIRTAILFPGFPDLQSAALFQAGQCDEVLGNTEQAIQNYQNLNRLYPESEFAGKARERISALKADKTE